MTVTASKAATTTTTGTLDGAALLTGVAPTFSSNVATTDGFTFTITNYDAATVYGFSADSPATVTRSGATVTVNGLTLGASAAVTVSAVKIGSTTASAINSGVALLAGVVPTFSGPNAIDQRIRVHDHELLGVDQLRAHHLERNHRAQRQPGDCFWPWCRGVCCCEGCRHARRIRLGEQEPDGRAIAAVVVWIR